MRPLTDLRTRFSAPSTYLLWTVVLLLQAATFTLLLDVLANGRGEILLGEIPPQAPLAPLFSGPLTWLLVLVVVPALALRQGSYLGAFSTWALFWTPALVLILVLRGLGLAAPLGPVLSAFLGLLAISGALLALAWVVARRYGRWIETQAEDGRLAWFWKLGRVVATFSVPLLGVWWLESAWMPREFDVVEQLRLFGRGVVPVGVLMACIGLAALLVWLAGDSRREGPAWMRRRRALLLIAALTPAGVLFAPRGDWTPDRLYGLSDAGRAALEEIDAPVDLHLVVSPQDSVEPYARELATRVRRAAPEVTVRVSEPDWGTASMPPTGRILLTTTYGERTLRLDELVRQDGGEVTLHLEPAVVAGLRELTGRTPVVAVSQGHSELPLPSNGASAPSESGSDGARENLTLLAAALQAQGVRVETLEIDAERRRRPDALLIAGPRTPWTEAAVRWLDGYIRPAAGQQGGKVLVLLDPRFVEGGAGTQLDLGLEGWLATLGVEVGRNVVVDPAGRLDAVGPETFTTDRFAAHPSVQSVAGRAPAQPAVLALARSVARADGRNDAASSGVEVTEILHTSRLGWGETAAGQGPATRGGDDLSGPVALAVAVETTPESRFRGSRLLVYGDASFVNDAMLSRGANAQLLRYGLDWLLDRGADPKIAPTHLSVPRWDAGGVASTFGWVLTLLVLASLAVSLGLWRRRQRTVTDSTR